MNKARREQIAKAVALVAEALELLEAARDEEQEYVDNFPENMQGTERYEAAEGFVSAMDNAITSLEEVANNQSDMTGE